MEAHAHSFASTAGAAGRIIHRAARFLFIVAVTFLGLIGLTFIIGRVIPIDPVLSILGERATEAQYQAAYQELGLDKPILTQFYLYVCDILSGDFGTSILSARPVLEDVARVFPATLELATVATILGIVLGVPMGVLSAARRGSRIDQIIRIISLVGYSMPIFWLGLVGLFIFYGQLGWVAGPGQLDIAHQFVYELDVPVVTGAVLIDSLLAGVWDVFYNAIWHIILPASVLGYYSMAYISRMTRSLMLEQLSQDYIVTARAKGMPEWRVIWVHGLRNIMVPLITVIALSYAYLLEGSVLTETVFAWPGLGLYITNALFSADMAAVLGGTIVVGMCFIFLNFLSDILYHIFDPRAR